MCLFLERTRADKWQIMLLLSFMSVEWKSSLSRVHWRSFLVSLLRLKLYVLGLKQLVILVNLQRLSM